MGVSRAAEAAESQRVVHDAHSGFPTVAAAPQRGDGALRSGCQCGRLGVRFSRGIGAHGVADREEPIRVHSMSCGLGREFGGPLP